MTLPENSVIFINVCVIGLIIFSLVRGFTRGVLIQIFKTLASLIILLLAWIISPGLSELLEIFPPQWAPFHDTDLAPLFYGKINTLCWFVIIVLVGLLIVLIIRPVFKVITEIPVVKQVNQLCGAVFALVPAFIAIVFATYLLNTALFSNGKDLIDNTVLKYTSVATDKVVSVLSNSFKENVAIQKMISDPLSLKDEDLKQVIEWLSRSKVSSDDIYNFLKNYGIDTKQLNELIKELEANNE